MKLESLDWSPALRFCFALLPNERGVATGMRTASLLRTNVAVAIETLPKTLQDRTESIWTTQ